MQFDFLHLSKLFSSSGLSRGSGGVIGVDIGSSAIKVVQLTREHGSAKLETYGELQLGPYADMEIGRATNLEPAKLTEALRDIIREASVTSRQAAISIAYSSSFVTVLSLPVTDESQLASSVPLEARKYVPVPINEVSLDWFVIPDAHGSEKKRDKKKAAQANTAHDTRILLAAIHNEALARYQEIAKGASISTNFFEIEIFSSIRSSLREEDDAVALIDIGAATTKLYIVEGGVIQRTHSMTAGAQDLTLALATALEMPGAEAEELKRRVGLLGEGDDARAREALRTELDRILSESRRVISSHEHTRAPVGSVVITGGGALLKGLSEYAAEQLEKDVELADPFSKVAYPAFLSDTLKEAGPSFAVAIGIALRRLNEM